MLRESLIEKVNQQSMLRGCLHLAIESTVHVAITIVITTDTALRIITTPRLARVLKLQRHRVDTSHLYLKHVWKLAVDVIVNATWSAELRNATHDVLQCVLESNIEAVLGGAAAGIGWTFVFLVLHDVHTAIAADVALCKRVRAAGWLGTSKGAECEGGSGEECGDCVAHFGGWGWVWREMSFVAEFELLM